MKYKSLLFMLMVLCFVYIFPQEDLYNAKEGSKMVFDKKYKLLSDMVESDYYPQESVEKIILEIEDFITYLETGITDVNEIQKRLDQLTDFINDMQNEFFENGSEIETVARDSIGETIGYILNYFTIDIDIETAIRNRDW